MYLRFLSTPVGQDRVLQLELGIAHFRMDEIEESSEATTHNGLPFFRDPVAYPTTSAAARIYPGR